MDISSVNSDLIRGNVTTIILNSLADGDRYGYDILKEIDIKSGGLYKLKQPTLYSCLKRLEKNGLIFSYPGKPDVTGGGQRKYYSLTDEGRNFLTKEKSEYEYSRTILDKLVSDNEFDATNPAPFNAEELRPYSKGKTEEKKIIYKEKIVYKYIDDSRFTALGIIPENSELDDREIAFLEESSFKNKSKIYQDAHETNFEEQSSIEPIEQTSELITSTNFNEQSNLIPQDNEETHNLKRIILDDIISNSNNNLSFNENLPSETIADEKPSPLPNSAENYDFNARKAFNGKTFYEKFDNLVKAREQLAKENAEKLALDTTEELDNTENVEQPINTVESTKPSRQMLFDLIAEAEQKHSKYISNDKNDIYFQNDSNNSSSANENIEENVQEDKEYATSFVTPKLEGNFEFEKVDNTYVDFYEGLTSSKLQTPPKENEEPVYQDAVLQNRLYSKGFTLKSYQRANTEEYYLNNFVFQNKLRRDSCLCTLATYLTLLAILWASCFEKVNITVFLSSLSIGIGLYLIPLITYFVKPKKKIKAKFNFKYTMLNIAMLFIELCVIVALIGFFIIGVDIHNIDSMLAPIVIPIVLLSTLLFMPIYYGLLYKTKKYHVT